MDQTGKQIAMVLCTNCTKRDGRMMAAFATQQMNIELRNKEKLKMVAAITTERGLRNENRG